MKFEKLAVVTRNGRVYHDKMNYCNHNEIIKKFNINKTFESDLIKIAFVSTGKRLDDVNSYELVVCQESTPSWFNEFKNLIKSKLRDIIQSMILTENVKTDRKKSYILTKNVVIEKMTDCNVLAMYDNSKILTLMTCCVWGMYNNSIIEKIDSFCYFGHGNKEEFVVNMYDNSNVLLVEKNSETEIIDNRN